MKNTVEIKIGDEIAIKVRITNKANVWGIMDIIETMEKNGFIPIWDDLLKMKVSIA